MEKSSVGYRGFSSTGPSPVDHKACGDVLSLSRLELPWTGESTPQAKPVSSRDTLSTTSTNSPSQQQRHDSSIVPGQERAMRRLRLRTWTGALPTKCTPRTMPQGNLPPRYDYSRTCRCLTTGSDLSSAWNTSSDVLPLDPSASDLRSFFSAHPKRQAPPTITPPSTDLSPEPACGPVRPPGDIRGVGMGVGRAYELRLHRAAQNKGRTGTPISVRWLIRTSRLKTTPIDMARLETREKKRPTAKGTTTIPSIRITRREVFVLSELSDKYLRQQPTARNDRPFPQHLNPVRLKSPQDQN